MFLTTSLILEEKKSIEVISIIIIIITIITLDMTCTKHSVHIHP